MKDKKILKLNHAARMFGVPVSWLKDQVEAGKIPAVRAGTVYLVKPKKVETFLIQQAEEKIQPALHRNNCVKRKETEKC
ncbi:MAG: helix-turn-helix domain-containing protein [Planctomycetota bacterium]|jgi:excisionase family DNA binding protein